MELIDKPEEPASAGAVQAQSTAAGGGDVAMETSKEEATTVGEGLPSNETVVMETAEVATVATTTAAAAADDDTEFAVVGESLRVIDVHSNYYKSMMSVLVLTPTYCPTTDLKMTN